MWQRKTPEEKRCHRHILAPFRPTGKERYRSAADKGAIQVIAGHRGWRGADYFRHIDRLQVGDTVVPFEDLVEVSGEGIMDIDVYLGIGEE